MKYSLKNEKDFNLVFTKGKKVFSKTLTLIYLNKDEVLKVGFAVSKKHGGSVTRNKIKRILRESFRSFLPQIQQNFFFVFIPKVLDNYSLSSFKTDMEYLLKKANAIEKQKQNV